MRWGSGGADPAPRPSRVVRLADTVEASGLSPTTGRLLPAYFNRNPHCPMPTHDFPMIIVIPFKHVRYMIGINMWTYQMPPEQRAARQGGLIIDHRRHAEVRPRESTNDAPHSTDCKLIAR